MPKIAQGTFPEMADIGIAAGVFPQSPGDFDPIKNEEQINRDKSRICLVDFTKATIVKFTNELSTPEFLKIPFTQGDLSGGMSRVRYMAFYKAVLDDLWKKRDEAPTEQETSQLEKKYNEVQEKNTGGCMISLLFAYRNVEGKLCGFGLSFNKNTPEDWIIDITQNTTSPKEQQTTTILTHGQFDNILEEKGGEILHQDLLETLSSALNSPDVSRLILGIINPEGPILLDNFYKLNSRIKANQNIDNRDAKQEELNKLFLEERNKFAPNQNQDLEQDIKTIEKEIETNPDFFIDDNFTETREKFRYTRALYDFTVKIDDWEKKPDISPDETYLLSQAKLILEDIENMSTLKPESPNENTARLTELTSKLVSFNRAIKENFPITPENHTKYQAYTQALDAFNNEIGIKQGTPGLQLEIVKHAGSISAQIKALASQHDKEENRLPRLTNMLNACTNALNNPSEDNINQLTACSKEASRKSSPAWKKLGKGLLVFAALTTAVALIVVSALAVVPSGGVSLLGVAAGIALLNSARVIARPEPSDLDNATEKFKDTLNSERNQNRKNENDVRDGFTPTNPAGN